MEKTVWIIIVLFVIILFSLLNFLMSIHPIKLGHKRVPSELNLEYENVSFKTSDNLILRGWFIPSNYSDAVIIVEADNEKPIDPILLELISFLVLR